MYRDVLKICSDLFSTIVIIKAPPPVTNSMTGVAGGVVVLYYTLQSPHHRSVTSDLRPAMDF